MAAPQPRGVGAVASGINAINPGLPAGTVTGDGLVLLVETSNEPVPSMAAAGWVDIGAGVVNVATGTITAATLRFKIAGAGEAAPTVPDSGDHQIARIIGLVAGTFDPADPIPAGLVILTPISTTTNPFNIPGPTTPDPDYLIVTGFTTGTDTATAQLSGSFGNAALTGLTTQVNNWTTSGGGGGIAAASGVKATAGAVGNTTASVVTANVKAAFAFAVKPVSAAAPLTLADTSPVGARAGSSADTAARGVALSDTTPGGRAGSTNTPIVPSTVFWLPHDIGGAGTYPDAPATPAYSSAWNVVPAAVRRIGTLTSRSNTTIAGENDADFAETSATVVNVLHRQYVGPQFGVAQRISGAFSVAIRTAETSTQGGTADASLQIVLRVVSSDGLTERGVLYAGHTAALNSTPGALGEEIPTTAASRIFDNIPITPLDVLATDRLVIEIGHRAHNLITTAVGCRLAYGDPNATAAFPLAAGNTTSLVPWVSVTGDLFGTAGGTPLTLTDTAPAGARARSTVDTAAAGLVLTDLRPAGAEAGASTGTAAVGVALADATPVGARAGATVDTATAVQVLNDTAPAGARAGATTGTLAIGVALADTPTVGARGGATADTAAVGLVLIDTPGAARAASSPLETLAPGLALTDTPGAARAGVSTGTLAIGRVLTEPATAGAAAGAAGTTVAAGVTLTDLAPAGARTGVTADTAAVGVVLADQTPPGARAGRTTGETATTALALSDPQTGMARLAATGTSVAVGVALSDATSGARAGSTTGQLAAGVVLAEPTSQAAQAGRTTGEAVGLGIILADPAARGVLAAGQPTTLAVGVALADSTTRGARAGATTDALAYGLILDDDQPRGARAGSTPTELVGVAEFVVPVVSIGEARGGLVALGETDQRLVVLAEHRATIS